MALESSVLQQKSLWNIKNDQNQSNQIKNILRFKDVYILINEKKLSVENCNLSTDNILATS